MSQLDAILTVSDVVGWLALGLISILVWLAKRTLARVDQLEKQVATLANDAPDETLMIGQFNARIDSVLAGQQSLKDQMSAAHARIDKLFTMLTDRG